MKQALFGSISGRSYKGSNSSVMGPIKLLPSSSSDRFLEATSADVSLLGLILRTRGEFHSWNSRQRAHAGRISMAMFSSLLTCRQQDGKIVNGFMADDIYLFETAHKVVTDWWPWEVCCARTASNIEKVIRAQHGVVFLRVSRCGQNSIHWYCHLDNKAQGKDTLYSDLHTGVLGYAWFWDLRRNPFSCLFEVWSWILVSYP